MNDEFTHWVACWGNATSIIDQKECVYAKDLTLRYPIWMCFPGSHLRLRFSNLTGTEPVTLNRVLLAKQTQVYQPVPVTFQGEPQVTIPPGQEVESDAIPFPVLRGDTVDVSLYLKGYTQMNSGVLITGPLSKGKYAYGDYADAPELPQDYSRNTNWFYFLNTIDVLTTPENHALICYGDSITAQSWPDYLTLHLEKEGIRNVSVIRRAVSGTRILREYHCITYAAYGLKGATRFPIEMNVAGARAVLIQHGINDIIHPVGTDVNPFRPWSDMPTLEDLERGTEEIYVKPARARGLRVYSGTLLPIYGWRTYNEDRDRLRMAFNEWLRKSPLFDFCVDFDETVRDPEHPAAFAPGFDSGDHLHPSEKAYEVMGEKALRSVIQSGTECSEGS